MPFMTPDVTDEADALATFAHQEIHQLATTIQGLTPEQLAATPSASAMSLGALVRHGILVGQNLVAGIRRAPAEVDPGDLPPRSPQQLQAEGGLDPSALRAEDTAEQLIAELDQAATEIDQLLREVDLDTEVPIPRAPWNRDARFWNIRFCALHAIEEFARHSGHADLLRESIDGESAYALNARADGEQWPPSWFGEVQAGADPATVQRNA